MMNGVGASPVQLRRPTHEARSPERNPGARSESIHADRRAAATPKATVPTAGSPLAAGLQAPNPENWRSLPAGRCHNANPSESPKFCQIRQVSYAEEQGPTKDPAELKIVTWNILMGQSFEELVHELQTNEALKDADFILMQEVDIRTGGSKGRDVFDELARRLKLNGIWVPAHGDVSKDPTWWDGNAVFSPRYELEARDIVRHPGKLNSWLRDGDGGRSTITVGTNVTIDGEPLVLASTHLEVMTVPFHRTQQARQFKEVLPEDGPTLVGGDFNIYYQAETAKQQFLRDGFVDPIPKGHSIELFRKLVKPRPDQILLRDLTQHYDVEAEIVDIFHKEISDHVPLSVRLSRKPN